MRECEYVFFTEDGTNIEYDVAGKGEKLILIHGSQGADEEIITLCGLLARSNTVYCPARRGWSCSGSKGWEYSMETECSDMIQLMEEFEIENIYGMIYGAVVAMHIALRYPVKKMILQSPYLVSRRDLQWFPKMRRRVEKEDYFGVYANYMRGTDRVYARIPYIFVKVWLKFILQRSLTDADNIKKVVTRNFKPEHLIRSELMFVQMVEELTAAGDAEAELSGLSFLETKTLILCDCNDEMYIHASAEQLLAQIPDSRKEIIRLMQYIPRRTEIMETCDFMKAVTEFLA